MQIKPKELKQAEMARTLYRVFVDAGTTKEQLVDPKTWAHVGDQLKMNDKIEILAEDGSIYAEALVMSSGVNFAKVRLVHYVEFSEKDEPQVDEDDLQVQFINNRYKWGVIRKNDNQWLVKELDTQGDAEQWLSNHRKALAA